MIGWVSATIGSSEASNSASNALVLELEATSYFPSESFTGRNRLPLTKIQRPCSRTISAIRAIAAVTPRVTWLWPV